MSASLGVFAVDFIMRPFAKIFEKMPFLMMFLLLALYGYIAYLVIRSCIVNQSTDHPY